MNRGGSERTLPPGSSPLHSIARGSGANSQVVPGQIQKMFGRDMLYVSGFVLQVATASVLTPILTRVLGPVGFGQVAASIAVVQVLVSIQALGLAAGVQRARYMPGGRLLARRVVGLSVIAVTSSATALYVLAPLWGKEIGFASTDLSRETVIWGALSAITSVVLGLLRAEDRLSAFILAAAVQGIGTQVLGLGVLALFGGGARTYLIGVVTAQFGALAVAVATVRAVRLPGMHLRPILEILRFSIPLVAQALAVYIYNSSDRLVISAFLGSKAVARYQVSYNLAGLGIVVLSLLTYVWLPGVMKAQATVRPELLAEMRKGIIPISGIVTLGLAFGAPAVLIIWVPHSYDPRGLVVVSSLVALSTLALGISTASFQALVTSGATAATACIAFTGSAINLAGNLVLVKRFGIDASAGTTIAAYALVAFLMAGLAGHRHLLPKLSVAEVCFIAAAGATTVGTCFLGTSGAFLAMRWVLAVACGVWLAIAIRRLMTPVGVKVQS
jgi:O-antigen/teichoic acid export membrane protein